MRKAAGIILIVLGMFTLVGMIIDMTGMNLDVPSSARLSMLMGTVPWGIVFGGLLIAGGVYCFRRRYWGLCLVSALIELCLFITPVVGTLLLGGVSALWRMCVMVAGTAVATIFISLRKKEWQEFSDSVDGKVSS